MTETAAPLPHHFIPKDRVCTLIDAIYAFSMTLLVTTIYVPNKPDRMVTGSPVSEIIKNSFPDITHYFIAFIILATLWYFEHQRFRHLRHLDRPLLWLSIASLAFVCFIPFTTNIAGDYPYDVSGAVIFELNILVIGLFAFVQWVYISSHRDLAPDLGDGFIRREIWWALVFPVLAIAGIAIAMFRIEWSPAIFLLAPVIMAVLFRKLPA